MRYSIDVIVVDVDYKDSEKNGQWGVGYEINETLFPDMAEFLKKCHDLGVSVMFNDHPIPVAKSQPCRRSPLSDIE